MRLVATWSIFPDLVTYFIVFYMTCTGVDPGFSERGSEHISVSLMQGIWGAQPQPPEAQYRVFCYYNTKIMLIVRFRAYLTKYKELFNQIWSRGCGGCNPLEHNYRLLYYKKC